MSLPECTYEYVTPRPHVWLCRSQFVRTNMSLPDYTCKYVAPRLYVWICHSQIVHRNMSLPMWERHICMYNLGVTSFHGSDNIIWRRFELRTGKGRKGPVRNGFIWVLSKRSFGWRKCIVWSSTINLSLISQILLYGLTIYSPSVTVYF